MKITITPETDKEREQREEQVFESVFEFALCGRLIANKAVECSLQQLHVNDKPTLIGRLEELKERVRGFDSS